MRSVEALRGWAARRIGRRTRRRLAFSAGGVLLALVATVVAERIFLRLTGAAAHGGAPTGEPQPLLSRCGLLALRTACDLLAIGLGLLAAIGVLFALLSGNELAPLVVASLLGTVAVIRAGAAIARAALVPTSRTWKCGIHCKGKASYSGTRFPRPMTGAPRLFIRSSRHRGSLPVVRIWE